MNALERYFGETGETVSSLARKIGRSVTAISRPIAGDRNASMNVALEVETATGSAVTAEDFLAICLAARRAKTDCALATTSEVASQ